MTAAFAPPAAMDRPRKEVVVKNVKGRLLQREESYTETFHEFAGEQTEDDVVLFLKPNSHNPTRPSDVFSFDPSALSPNISPALQRNVRAWGDATGLPTTITLRFKDRVFHLHKFPLVSRSGYFKRLLKETKDVTIPSDVPGGPEIFELALIFCYGSTILMEPSNIAEIYCVAEYLQMTEDYGSANLCERSELYLNQVALQSWDDTFVVLLHCENLTPYAEQLGIVRRCLDALAFMACMELLDPVARKAVPSKTGELHCWATNMREGSHLHWWIQDLVVFPPSLFVKVILALRRGGMQENYVGQVITAFADRWIFGSGVDSSVLVQTGSDKCWVLESQTKPEMPVLIESVVRLLPLERHVVPIGFLFGLLRRGLSCALHEDCRIQLETRIALQFEHATLQDLLLPSRKEKDSSCVFRNELDSMERILKLFLTRFRGYDDARLADMSMLSEIGKLWDEYLAEIAFDSSITPGRFAELVERIPAYMRVVHDHVYRAIHTYLKAHPNTTQEERLLVCRTLNCQKLSQDACSHAVQNDLMPLRLIVQAMFMQQLQTRSVLTSHIESASQSFRGDHHFRSLLPDPATPSTFYYPSAGQSARLHPACEFSQDSFRSVGSSFRDNDLYLDDLMYAASHNISSKDHIPSKDHLPMPPNVPRVDYHATESRLRSLEAELSRMRQALSHTMHASTSASPPAKPVTDNPPSPSAHTKVQFVEEVGAGSCGPLACMGHLKPATRSGGLFARTLQKLRSRSFAIGKSSAKQPRQEPVISAPIAASVERASFRHCGLRHVPSHDAASRLQLDVGRHAGRAESASGLQVDMGRRVGRTDSMPRPAVSRAGQAHHVRHRSIS